MFKDIRNLDPEDQIVLSQAITTAGGDTIARDLAAEALSRVADRQVSLSGALDWQTDLPSLDVRYNPLTRRGSIGYTPQQFFALFSTALSSPDAIYYVDGSAGTDSNDGLSWGTAFRTADKAQQVANAGGVPALIYCKGAIYYSRTGTPAGGSGTTVPTVPMAWLASGGRVTFATYDAAFATTADATYSNTYSTTLADADFALDRRSVGERAWLQELPLISTPAILNAVPEGSAHDTGKWYGRRMDGLQPALANTFVLRRAHNYLNTGSVPVFFGRETSKDYFEFLGGGQPSPTASQSKGPVNLRATTLPSNKVGYVFDGCRFGYGFRNLSVDSIHGYVFLNDCAFGHAMEDGLNIHREREFAAQTRLITLNCKGYDFGRTSGGGQSCNAWTLHEDCEGLDVCGDYHLSRGGLVRNIGSSKAVLAGTLLGSDLGDQTLSGTNPPIIARVDDTSQLWMDGVGYRSDAVGAEMYTGSESASIRYRNMDPPIGPEFGPGFVGSWE